MTERRRQEIENHIDSVLNDEDDYWNEEYKDDIKIMRELLDEIDRLQAQLSTQELPLCPTIPVRRLNTTQISNLSKELRDLSKRDNIWLSSRQVDTIIHTVSVALTPKKQKRKRPAA